jgi:hypothetical protein
VLWVHAKSEGPLSLKNISYHYIQILTLLVRELTEEEHSIYIAKIEGKLLVKFYHFKIKTVLLFVKKAGGSHLETVL